jgi:hypothetical protein
MVVKKREPRKYKGIIRYIYILPEQDEALRLRAKLAGKSISKVVREMLEREFGRPIE